MDYQAQQIVILRHSTCMEYASYPNGQGVIDASADAHGRAGVISNRDFHARTTGNYDNGNHQERDKD